MLLALCSAMLHGPALADESFSWEAFLARNDVVFDKVGTHWTQGPFIGNGEMGALIYHETNAAHSLRFELSRNDLYNAFNFGRRVPTGHLYLNPVGRVRASAARLDLWNAEAVGVIETDGGKIAWRTFAHAPNNLIYIEIDPKGGETRCRIEYDAERSAELPAPVVTRRGDATVSVQPWKGSGGAATAMREIAAGTTRVFVVSLAVNWSNPPPTDAVCAAVASPAAGDIASARAAHREWWHAFYRKSFLSIPDARLESFYWAQLYKLGSATRENRAAIDLLGPWYRPTWPKYWMNLNLQLTYYPVYAANHLELGESLIRWLCARRASLTANAPPEWQHDSAALPRATGLDLRGDVRNNGKELGNLTYLLHDVYLHYRYSMDEQLLREVLYPLLTRSVNFYRHVLVKEDDGKYHLLVTDSPEYGRAEDCNYDLALLRWACGVLIESAARLKLDEPLVPVWKEILANLTPYPVDGNGLMIGRGVPFAKSHRHYSHLFPIFPLATLDLVGADRALALKSMNHWLGLTGKHTGYTYTGAASMAAYFGDGDRALALLNVFCDQYAKPNTFYTEPPDLPTIETPLSAARSIQDMVLQSWGGTIRVFPAVPSAWTNVVFRDLRTEGAFLVSALRADGKTKWIRVQSLAGEPCLLRTDMASPVFDGLPPSAISKRYGVFHLALPKGGQIVISESGQRKPDIAPVARVGVDNPWGSR